MGIFIFSVKYREIAVILISGLLENKTKKEVDKLSDSIIYGWDAHWVVGFGKRRLSLTDTRKSLTNSFTY